MSDAPHATVPVWIRQRRWWLLPLGAWVVAVGLAWQSHIADIRSQSIAVATEGARNMFRMVVLTRSWNARHGGVYVPVDANTQPNPYLEHPQRDITTLDGRMLTLINPAYMTRLIGEMAELESGAIFRLTSLKPIRPQNAADAWERNSLQRFEAGEKEVIEIVPDGRGDLLRYMAPLRVEAACLPCHAQQGYQVGDIRGGISVSQRYGPIQAPTNTSIRQSTLTYGAVGVLVSLLGWWALEMLRRRWIDLSRNIQELGETRLELVQSEKMASLGRMVAGFAHEINTPVGVAVGAISHHEDSLRTIEAMLTQDEVDETQLRAELEHLRQGGALALSNLNRAARLVQSFKRTSIDQTSEAARIFAVHDLIHDVLYTLHNVLKRTAIETRVECEPQLRISGPAGALEQVITNLVLNAVQHAFDDGKQAGHIVLQAQREEHALVLRCSDDGCGMPPEQAQRVFEPFFTTRRGQGGTGLGLYVCYQIATTQLRGTLSCHSAPLQGTTFELRFNAHFVESSEAT